MVSTVLDPYLSLRALASYSGLSVRTLRSFIDRPPDQALPCYRVSAKLLVRKSEFDQWMKQFGPYRGRPSLTQAIHELGLSLATGAGNVKKVERGD